MMLGITFYTVSNFSYNIEYLPSYYLERYATIMLHFEFSLKCKIGHEIDKTEFIQK